MKRTLAVFFVVALFACNSKTDKVADDEGLSETNTGDSAWVSANDSSGFNSELSIIWQIDYETKTKKRNPVFSPANLQPDSLIKALNMTYPEIILEKVKLSGDTLYTRIPESEYLTERIGSYGASLYVAEAVINLTTVPGINFIHIQFIDGSHLSSGTWAKAHFANYNEVK